MGKPSLNYIIVNIATELRKSTYEQIRKRKLLLNKENVTLTKEF